jgi:hypothetical protein
MISGHQSHRACWDSRIGLWQPDYTRWISIGLLRDRLDQWTYGRQERRSLYKWLSERRAQSIEGYGVDNLGQTASNPRRLRDQEPQVFAIPNFRNTPKWQLW